MSNEVQMIIKTDLLGSKPNNIMSRSCCTQISFRKQNNFEYSCYSLN